MGSRGSRWQSRNIVQNGTSSNFIGQPYMGLYTDKDTYNQFRSDYEKIADREDAKRIKQALKEWKNGEGSYFAIMGNVSPEIGRLANITGTNDKNKHNEKDVEKVLKEIAKKTGLDLGV